MTRDEFAKVYQQCRPKALEIARKETGSLDRAEDAVQNAAVYCLENLARFSQIKATYFYQLARNRARDLTRSRVRREAHETVIGLIPELSEAEEHAVEREIGRKRPAPRAQ